MSYLCKRPISRSVRNDNSSILIFTRADFPRHRLLVAITLNHPESQQRSLEIEGGGSARWPDYEEILSCFIPAVNRAEWNSLKMASSEGGLPRTHFAIRRPFVLLRGQHFPKFVPSKISCHSPSLNIRKKTSLFLSCLAEKKIS